MEFSIHYKKPKTAILNENVDKKIEREKVKRERTNEIKSSLNMKEQARKTSKSRNNGIVV